MAGTWLGLATVISASVPAALAAFFSYRSAKIGKGVSSQLTTGNDKTVGEMVTEVHGHDSAQETPFDTHRPETA